ncbi:Ornithine decarboxylase, inducible [Salmonella enterica subsp. enterica serovar Sanjuan]|uniref:Ornithine decarboxylase, inducible n=1 Tax=Salmonella enterica subsp. enterica serovar Sanjuan TaxID=1160765 RepID=A0A447NYK4_SALET|nr:Ornithine decarboxylase, inducible [Salmonella enterica subsp. enterica serovar Sanjuan]
MAKLQQLVALLARFEKLLEADAPLAEVLPSIYKQHEARYAGYTLRQLCQEMHDLYARNNVKQLQKEMFRKSHFPKVSMNPQEPTMPICAARSNWFACRKRKVVSRLKALCLTRRECCV